MQKVQQVDSVVSCLQAQNQCFSSFEHFYAKNVGGIVTSYDVLCENLWNQLGAIVGEDTGNRTSDGINRVQSEQGYISAFWRCPSISGKMVTVNKLVKKV